MAIINLASTENVSKRVVDKNVARNLPQKFQSEIRQNSFGESQKKINEEN